METKYFVKSAYKILSNLIPTACIDIFRVLWSLLIPPSAQCFTWRALQDRIATKQNLVRRVVHLADSFLGFMWEQRGNDFSPPVILSDCKCCLKFMQQMNRG